MRERIPADRQAALDALPAEFVDDGCSKWFDAIFRWSLRWCCRLHDASYCTRLHPAGSRTYAAKILADEELKTDVALALPWALRATAGLMWIGVRVAGSWWHGWDSCGPEVGERCKHGMAMPAWMTAG